MILINDENYVLRNRHLGKPCEARKHQHGCEKQEPLQFFENHKPPLDAILPLCAHVCMPSVFENQEFSCGSPILVHARSRLMTNPLTNDEIVKERPEREHVWSIGVRLDLSSDKALSTRLILLRERCTARNAVVH